jgi:hypothetical protein
MCARLLKQSNLFQTKEKTMQSTEKTLRPVVAELNIANYNQDLVEAPKRAQLDRAAEGAQFIPPVVVPFQQNK